jgi:PBP/GOBP family
MNAEGVPQKEVMIEKLANKAGVRYQPLEQLIEKCVVEKGANECETAYKIFECYWTNHALAKNGELAKNVPATN